MRIDGNSPEEIARELEVEKRTVYLWFSDPLIKVELASQVDRVNELFAERLAGVALKALDALCVMAELPVRGELTPETKLKILRELLDRAQAGAQGAPTPAAMLKQLSDQQLIGLARSLMPGPANGRPPVPPNAR